MTRALITGAASGIGRAVAARLARQPGAALLLVDRDEPGLRDAAGQLGDARVETLTADLGEVAAAGEAVALAAKAFGGLDCIVSNAGVMRGAPLVELSVDDFDHLFRINTRPTFLLAQAAYEHLRASRGSLVATASLAAEHATPPLGAYAASKAALVMLVKQLALEWGPLGIRCNCVSPGPTLTGMSAAGYADAARRKQREDRTPLRRIAEADDIAAAIEFLASAGAKHITGQNLVIDGGLGVSLMALAGAGTGQAQAG